MISALLLTLFFAGVLGGSLHCHDESFTPDYILRVTLEPHSIGCGTTRDTYLVNGSSPGPLLYLTPGKISWIRVYNDVPDSNLTMHWHGLSQRMAPFSDGTPQTSQWDIAPMHFFDYEVFPETLDSGTYFYHSHVNFQAVSVTGPIIVYDNDKKAPYEYEEERVVMLTDYFNETDAEIVSGLLADPFVWSGETNGVLLNGQGVTDIVQASGEACPLPTFDMEPGKKYRFRFIGGTALSLVSLKLEDHNMTIIAADARYTNPQPIDYLQIGTGQRFDVLIQAKTQEELKQSNRTSYYLKFQTKDRPSVYTGYALFRYNTHQTVVHTPATYNWQSPNDTYNFLEYTLEPLYRNDFPTADEVTRRLTMTVSQQGSALGHIRWYENQLNWTEYAEPHPLLMDIYLHGEEAVPNYERALANGGWDPVFKAWPAKIGEVLELVIQNTGSEVNGNGGLDIHPFHAHAGHYYDIGRGYGAYDATENEQRLADYSPVLRDTTYLYRYNASVGAGQDAAWRAWRIRVDDAGVYLIHCHILQHMIMGMQTAWVFGNASEISKVPHEMAKGYLTYGGNAYGSDSIDPIVYHYYEEHLQRPWE